MTISEFIRLDKTAYLALAMLLMMGLLMYLSSLGDSAIMDELAHIPAGYSYVYLRDYRLNPEHPPLIKDISALPLALFNLNFPTDVKSWQEDVNGQWTQGAIFLYESDNDPDKILFWMRLPLMLLTLFFGWIFFSWARSYFGEKTAILGLAFYAFSPTFIAHSRFVTTDLGAALAFFIGIIYFVRFLENPTRKNIIMAGVVFGIAQLLKFSLFLLIPIYGALLLIWVLIQTYLSYRDKIKVFLSLLGKTALIGIIGILVIWAVYAYHVWNYPVERQLSDSEFLLSSFGNRLFANIDLWMIQQPLLRPLAQYFLGVLMVIQRVAGGNTTYFLGEVGAGGSALYFPVVYLLKEPLAFHFFSLTALLFALRKIINVQQKSLSKIVLWARSHYIEVASWLFIVFYWAYSVKSPLNIGVRHLLPTFPFIYVLVAKEITRWIEQAEYANPQTWFGFFKNIYQLYIKAIPKYLFTGALLIWLISGTLTTFPHFLSYYNELAGGTDRGFVYAVDSNYDWGQDLRRLKEFVDTNGVEKINLDYFGGGSPLYYLGDRFEPWWSAKGRPESGEWFAISATFLQGAHGIPSPGFIQKEEDTYEWLKPHQPVARAGKSIFIYRLP